MSRRRWCPAYLALGSNLDDPAQHLSDALRDLDDHLQINIYRVSRVVRSAPMDASDQPEYLNAVIGLMTTLSPAALLGVCQQIEAQHGRRHDAPRWSARALDLDIVGFAQTQIDEPGLTIPHPGVTDRAFVLLPLLDIAPTLALPGIGRLDQHANAVDATTLQSAASLHWPPARPVAL